MSWTRYLLLPFLVILCILISFFASQYLGDHIPLNTSWLGYVIIIIALFNIVRTIRLIRSNKIAVNALFKGPTHFIKTGSFKYSRNPIYLGFLLILIGIGLLFGTFSGFTGAVVFFIVVDLWYIPFKENKLGQIFGEEYFEYKRNVRRWV